MATKIKVTVSRCLAHVCLLLTALASHAVSAQQPPRSPAGLEKPSAEVVNQLRQQTREKNQRDGRLTSAKGSVGTAAVAARCVEGYIVSATHRASGSDVKIVAAERRDCDRNGCRAYQVNAARDGTQPFDLEVSLTCA